MMGLTWNSWACEIWEYFFLFSSGSEYVEKAPLEVCAKLVIDSKRERREKEKLENLKRQDEDAAKLKRDLSAFQYEEEDENEGIKGELARTRERLSSTKSRDGSQN